MRQGEKEFLLVILRLLATLGRFCVEVHYGTVFGRNFHPVSQRDFVITNKRVGSVSHSAIRHNNDTVSCATSKGPKWAKSKPVFRPKRRKNRTLWGGTYLNGLYKGTQRTTVKIHKCEIRPETFVWMHASRLIWCLLKRGSIRSKNKNVNN